MILMAFGGDELSVPEGDDVTISPQDMSSSIAFRDSCNVPSSKLIISLMISIDLLPRLAVVIQFK